jgi:hypothetical protein
MGSPFAHLLADLHFLLRHVHPHGVREYP